MPDTLRPPVQVTLTRSADTIPPRTALPGGWVAEPKFDGYRLVVVRDGDTTTLWSRAGTDLTARFPEIAAAAAAQVPPGTVVDGEVVVWSDGRLRFELLQSRMSGGAATVARAARKTPASYVGFDVLAAAGSDVRRWPFTERRAVLEDLAAGWVPPMNLSPVTEDPAVARAWLTDLPVTGVEGLVLKGAAQRYEPGRRAWVKVKHRATVDVIAGAVTGPVDRPTTVIAGLPVDGQLRIVGRTVPLSAVASRALGAQLVAAAPDGHPWPAQVSAAAAGGAWGRSAAEVVDLTLVEPLVVEVTADAAWSGRSFRHPLRFVRARPDLDPDDVAPPGSGD